MTNCTSIQLEFASCQGRKVQADFGGGEVSSDGGLLLLREVDRHLKLLKRAAAATGMHERDAVDGRARAGDHWTLATKRAVGCRVDA